MTTVQPNTGGGPSYTPPAVPGHISLPGFAQTALRALSMAPGIPGYVGTAIGAGLNANNLIAGNMARPALGLGDTNPLSFLAGMVGLNNRADLGGNQTIAAPGEISVPNDVTGTSSPAVTQGGMYDASPFGFLARLASSLGIGSGYFDPRGAYTMQEAVNRNVNNPGVAANMLFNGLRAAQGGGFTDQNRMAAYGLTPGSAGVGGPAIVAGGGGGTGPNPLASAVSNSLTANQIAANQAKVAANNGQSGGGGGNQGGINGNINPGVGAGTMNANTGMLGHI